MWEWIGRNKEWIFSGVGISVLLLLFWPLRAAIGKCWAFIFKKEIIVRVRGAVANHPLKGVIHALAIIVENHSGREIVIGNFLLATKNQNIYVKADGMTGQPQHRQTVRPGDSCTFHVLASELAEIGLPPEVYVAAVVETPLGKEFRSSSKALQASVRGLLNRSGSR